MHIVIMAMVRKVVGIGRSRAIIIPRSYLNFWKLQGRVIRQVELEITDKILITPILEEIAKGKKEG